MGILLLTTFLMLVGESSGVFRMTFGFAFSGYKRFITVGVCFALWLVVLGITFGIKGKEIVWVVWIATSLCIAMFQMLFISLHVVLDKVREKTFKQ